MRRSVFTKTWFWVIGFFLSLACGIGAYYLFPVAFPIVSLDLTMDRTQALSQATSIAKQLHIGPQEYDEAAIFTSDTNTKNFIELEAGGSKELTNIIKQEYFAPYFWYVRHFNPHQKHEAQIFFMPDGRPYGFNELLPEDMQLPSLDQAQAQQLAEQQANANWSINFSIHKLVEHSEETQPNGRVDHTFVYERTDAKVDDAPYRVTIVVSGNTVTKVDISIKVPQTFDRKYQHMRSANNMIATGARTILFLLYILLGCIVGLIVLMRTNKNWLIWRAPLYWALFIAGGQLLSSLNSFPFWWLNYNTAQSKINFLLSMGQTLIVGFGFNVALLFLVFSAAESLTRKAFGDHIQLWSLSKLPVASSWQVIGRTLGGYLLLGFKFLFLTVFYIISSRYFGWWNPTDTLVNPNVLATYVPWFTAVIVSLQAGFMEECLFRAVPLSCAALLGDRYGKKRWWIIAALILQAIIFGAAHANYPAQPAYARVVEIFIPYIIMGLIFLRFGLLPVIITHVLYDVILFALPIFISDTPGIWASQLITIACCAIPLLVLVYARGSIGSWHELAASWYNKAWRAPEKKLKPTTDFHEPIPPRQPALYRKIILIVAALGVVACSVFFKIAQDVPPIQITRSQAIEKAQEAQKEFNLSVPENATTLANLGGTVNDEDVFVWRTLGKNIYKKLMSTYLTPARWQIHYATFDGDIAQSAEEYAILIGPDGTPIRFKHTLPKEQEGARLQKEAAQKIAYQLLGDRYQLQPNNVVEISAREHERPNRRDWKFIFKIKDAPEIKEGQLRISIKIGGDKVIHYRQFVHVPEQFARAYEAETKRNALISNFCALLLFLLGTLLFIGMIRKQRTHKFALRAALIVLGLLLIKSLVLVYTLWPTAIMQFKTSAPYYRQVMALVSNTFIQIIFRSLFMAWLAGYIIPAARKTGTLRKAQAWKQGFSIGLLIMGLSALAAALLPATKPFWVTLTDAGGHLPWLTLALRGFTTVLKTSIIGIILLHSINIITDFGRKYRYGLPLLLILIGIAGIGLQTVPSVSGWLVSGLGAGLLAIGFYYTILRYSSSTVPAIAATVVSIQALQLAVVRAWPTVWLGAIVTICLSYLVAWWFIEQIQGE